MIPTLEMHLTKLPSNSITCHDSQGCHKSEASCVTKDFAAGANGQACACVCMSVCVCACCA